MSFFLDILQHFYRVALFLLRSMIESTRNIHTGMITHFLKNSEIQFFGLARQRNPSDSGFRIIFFFWLIIIVRKLVLLSL